MISNPNLIFLTSTRPDHYYCFGMVSKNQYIALPQPLAQAHSDSEMETTDVGVVHLERRHKDKYFIPVPIFCANFMTTTEMQISLRSTNTFQIFTVESVQKLSLHRLGSPHDIGWHGGKQRTGGVFFFCRIAMIHICKFALQRHGLRLRVQYSERSCCLYNELNARHYICNISSSSDHEDLKYGGVILR